LPCIKNYLFIVLLILEMQTAKEFIDHYKLQPHPEGGYYRETYRSPETIVHTA
jgi:predicted cupin superfamily sugar epimerase